MIYYMSWEEKILTDFCPDRWFKLKNTNSRLGNYYCMKEYKTSAHIIDDIQRGIIKRGFFYSDDNISHSVIISIQDNRLQLLTINRAQRQIRPRDIIIDEDKDRYIYKYNIAPQWILEIYEKLPQNWKKKVNNSLQNSNVKY